MNPPRLRKVVIAPADPLLGVGASSPHFDSREWMARPMWKVVAYTTEPDSVWPVDVKQAPWHGPHVLTTSDLETCFAIAADWMRWAL